MSYDLFESVSDSPVVKIPIPTLKEERTPVPPPFHTISLCAPAATSGSPPETKCAAPRTCKTLLYVSVATTPLTHAPVAKASAKALPAPAAGRTQVPRSSPVTCHLCRKSHKTKACPACFNCGKTGHVQHECQQQLQCYHCQGSGHIGMHCQVSTPSQRAPPPLKGNPRAFAHSGTSSAKTGVAAERTPSPPSDESNRLLLVSIMRLRKYVECLEDCIHLLERDANPSLPSLPEVKECKK